MTHATLRSEFENLIDPYAPVGQLGTGFTFTEGPIWHPAGHYLLFSDMPADVRRRWDSTRGVVEVKRPSNKCNGMTYDAELNLFEQPNGLCFSPDEKRLYVNDTVQARIRVFDVEADGSLANARVFASGIRSELEPGLPDGMKCDQLGNIWVTAPGGVWVYAMSGDLLGKVRVPELVANLSWGGADFRTLFMTATHSVYTVTTKVGPRIYAYITSKGGTASAASSVPAPVLSAAG